MIPIIFSYIGIIASYLFVGWFVLRFLYIFEPEEKNTGIQMWKFVVMIFFPVVLMAIILNYIYQISRNEKEIKKLKKEFKELKKKRGKKK